MLKILSKLYFKIIGWRTSNDLPPDLNKYVMIGAPHTSNWDFPIAMAALRIMGIKVNYLAKKELFRFPLGILMKALGGIPVDRNRNTGMVDAMIAEFNNHQKLVLLVPPEGTRGYVKEWKTGFYRVAFGAGVPIALAYLDYKRKIAGIERAFVPTGDYEKDLNEIQTFYRGIQAKHPELSSVR